MDCNRFNMGWKKCCVYLPVQHSAKAWASLSTFERILDGLDLERRCPAMWCICLLHKGGSPGHDTIFRGGLPAWMLGC